MRFEITDHLILFHDTRPGEHATLFHNGMRVPFRGDESRFNDSTRRYAWAFALPTLAAGDVLAFATADREAIGVVAEDGAVSVLVNPGWRIVRLGAKPYAVESK